MSTPMWIVVVWMSGVALFLVAWLGTALLGGWRLRRAARRRTARRTFALPRSTHRLHGKRSVR